MKSLLIVIVLFIGSCNFKNNDKTATTSVNNSVADSIIISERIDGPANIREAINGKLLFTLNDNVAVSANEPQNKWIKVGVFADLTQQQMNALSITKGSKIFIDGKEAGQATENIQLVSTFKSNDGLKAELVGYSSISNIKPATIPENAFATIVNNNPSALTITSFKHFLKDFQFNDYNGLLPNFKGYEIDESWIDDPSPLLRLWLLFDSDKLYGVFHSRPLKLNATKTTKVKRGFYYSSFGDDEKINKDIISAFNSFIVQVD